jgi:hypothetical protein
MLYLTLLAYWVWGTLNCFTYYQPHVFTTNVPLTTDSANNLNVTMGGFISSSDPESTYQYLSIVFQDGINYYNSTKQIVGSYVMYVPDTTECSSSLGC